MTSFQRFEANRRNALHSTGPKTEDGKHRSRLNAVRHGLTAETVVGSLEDAEDYKAFEAAIIADYCAETAVARRYYGGFVAPPRLRPIFSRSKLKHCGNAVLRFRRIESEDHMEVSFALSRALFVLTRTSIQETVHGLMAARELRRSINAKASIMPPATAPARPAN